MPVEKTQTPYPLTIVAMLDVLGARVETRAEADDLVGRIKDVAASVRNATNFRAESFPVPPILRVFGDTLVYVFENLVDAEQLALATQSPSALVARGLMRGVALRGAIGMGDVVIDDRGELPLVLGPGITNAAQWYDKLNMIGAVASPQLGAVIDLSLASRELGGPLGMGYARYQVPLKGGTRREMWAVTWDEYIGYSAEDQSRRPLDLLLHWLCGFRMPYGTEAKYEEARKFFDWCQQQRLARRPTSESTPAGQDRVSGDPEAHPPC